MDIDISNSLVELEAKGLTQTEIALALGCKQSSVSDMKNGKLGTVRPSFKIVDGLKRLCKKHGVLMVGKVKDSALN